MQECWYQWLNRGRKGSDGVFEGSEWISAKRPDGTCHAFSRLSSTQLAPWLTKHFLLNGVKDLDLFESKTHFLTSWWSANWHFRFYTMLTNMFLAVDFTAVEVVTLNRNIRYLYPCCNASAAKLAKKRVSSVTPMRRWSTENWRSQHHTWSYVEHVAAVAKKTLYR